MLHWEEESVAYATLKEESVADATLKESVANATLGRGVCS